MKNTPRCNGKNTTAGSRHGRATASQHECESHGPSGAGPPEQRAAGEGVDETEQIQDQRHHPEQRCRRDVGGDVAGHAEQQARGHRAVGNPAKTLACARRLAPAR